VGTYSATVQATDADGFSGSGTLAWTVDQAPGITSASSVSFTNGIAGAFSVTTVGTPTPWVYWCGTLPAGVNIVDGNGEASLSGTPAMGTAGTYQLTFTAVSTVGTASQAFTLIVLASTPAVTLTSSANPDKAATAVTFTATVSGSPTPWTPTGSVTFSDNGTGVKCSGEKTTIVDISSGLANCKYTPTTSGAQTIAVAYSGDANFTAASTSIPQMVLGTTDPTSVVTTSSANPSAYGAAVTLTTTITGSTTTPSGSVDFVVTVSGTAITICVASPVSGSGIVSAATCVYTPPASGNVGISAKVTATYSGDGTYKSEEAAALTQTVLGNNVLSGFSLSSSLNPANPNKAVTYTATLSGAEGTPTGVVTFFDNGNLISCTAKGTINASGIATCKYTPAGVGSHTITAVYSGDDNYAEQSTPSVLIEVVA
jgi:hypothetical protein